MYSIFFSKIDIGFSYVESRLKEIIKPNSKVVIIPWSFPIEIDAKGLDEFFSGKRKERYVNNFKKIGIKEENIIILNCYRDNEKYMKEKIKESDILVLPGGNPEMFYNKVLSSNILEDIKNYQKIIIGASAGTELQLNNYFITAKNNYYKKFAWYKGFNVIDDPFYMDVHTSNNYRYLNKLSKVAKETNKKVYAIYDDGVIIYNRSNNKVELYGNIKVFDKE